MSNSKDETTRLIGAALDILKKRWNLKTRVEVIKQLLETAEPTTLQIAERKLKIENDKKEE
jgi:hypothetical protein